MSSDEVSKFKINEGICRPTIKYGVEEFIPGDMAALDVSSIKQKKRVMTTMNALGGQDNSDSFNNRSTV